MFRPTRLSDENASLSFRFEPLLYLVEQNLMGIRLGHHTTKTAVVAYANDITIFVTWPAYIQAID
jgi:hypothetical protein